MVTITSQVQVGPRTWRVSWSSDVVGATFRVAVNGVEVTPAATSQTFWDVTVFPGQDVIVEVLDDTSEAFEPFYARTATLGWDAVSGAAEYLVEQSVSGVWTERARLPERGAGYYEWESGRLADATLHEFRMTPLDAAGNAGSRLVFAHYVIGVPDEVTESIAVAYAAGDFTFSEV